MDANVIYQRGNIKVLVGLVILIVVACFFIPAPKAHGAELAKLPAELVLDYYGAEIPLHPAKTATAHLFATANASAPADIDLGDLPSVEWMPIFDPEQSLRIQVRATWNFKTVTGKVDLTENDVLVYTDTPEEGQIVPNPRGISVGSETGRAYSMSRAIFLPKAGEYRFKLRFEVIPGVFVVSKANYSIQPQAMLVYACQSQQGGAALGFQTLLYGTLAPQKLDVSAESQADSRVLPLGQATLNWVSPNGGYAMYNLETTASNFSLLTDMVGHADASHPVVLRLAGPNLQLLVILTPQLLQQGCGKG